MKKLLKSEVCRIHEQCIGALFIAEKSKHAAGKKEKKRKERNANVNLQTANADPNGYLASMWSRNKHR